MDTLWITASAIAALVAVAVALRIALKPRRFKPKSDAYWKEKARDMQKKHTGQVISWNPRFTKGRSRTTDKR
ncbi:hypothetical protein SAMN04244572_02388 [Azotobacter beijerinckii]|uniref:Uncharacterized protein n=1 Tax=Azotobacter beijerinckii TaxID=170623 RepID=A0A1H6V5C2_9GAMM|nr:hypothetical protein [Azotobacter beijerinckii]SEI99763.1 hypothetical protein SAMN04244572_02388 [Azotobacter beijerinckii]SEJ62245.1 hypothetical protein SAMN04244579_04935 [Azotobacter beijerinckii]SER98305.1 hypothetical protein SAMN04244573_04689 [Azotobacter beijerinckii]